MDKSEFFRGEMKSFEIQHVKADGKNSRVITIEMRSNGKDVVLIFNGVLETKDICFSSFEEILVRVTDLSDRGWEGQSIAVGELIDQNFSFYCDNFIVKWSN